MNNHLVYKLNTLIDKYHILEHPFYNALASGNLSIKSLKNFAIQYSHHVSNFPRYISAIHSNCDQIRIRQLLLDNLNEEENKSESHLELWHKFLNGLDIKSRDLNTNIMLKATRNLNETFRLLSKTEKYHIGLSALYCYEYMQPDISFIQKKSIKKFYNLKDEEALKYFTVHMSADKKHRKILGKIITKFCSSSSVENDVLSSVKITLGSLNSFFSAIYKDYNSASN